MGTQEIPTAIRLVDQEEETWRARHIGSTLVQEVGRLILPTQGVVYYGRSTPGTSVEDLKKLHSAEKIIIDREHALFRRRALDYKWLKSPIMRELLTDIWRSGRMGVYDDSVSGIFHTVEDDHEEEYPSYTLMIKPDGAINLRIDNPDSQANNQLYAWHEYTLPRGTSECVRVVDLPDEGNVTKTVINPREIVDHVIVQLQTIKALCYDELE